MSKRSESAIETKVICSASDSSYRDMNKKKIYKWLYKKAADAIGEEELESLKNDLVNPVKIAAKEALDDIISDYNNGPGDD